MEITMTSSLSGSKLSGCSSSSLFPHIKAFPFVPNSSSPAFGGRSARCIITRMKGLKIRTNRAKTPGFLQASVSDISSTAADEERWILEPVGDGDTRHIGFKVEMPAALEISSNDVTVGRSPEKVDMVIPVATVSGVHARIQKKGGSLLVTDLDSTNGTFINEKRLSPGVPAPASPGSYIIFGDTNLAMFRAFKLENKEPAGGQSALTSEGMAETSPIAESTEATS